MNIRNKKIKILLLFSLVHLFTNSAIAFSASDTEGNIKSFLGVVYDWFPDAFEDSIITYKNSAHVREVYPGGPAQVAGIKKGDLIIKVNDTSIENKQQLADYISTLPVGAKPKITILRFEQLDFYPVLKESPFQKKNPKSETSGFKPIPFE